MKNKIITLICLILFLTSCQTLKDGLTGKKQENSDEFLVEKKNPLEIPPNFKELPVPKVNSKKDKSQEIDEEIEELVKSLGETKEIESKNQSAEDFILKEINKN